MSASSNPPAPSVTVRDFKSIVRKLWGKDWTKAETAYSFTGGRKFNNTDDAPGGPYGDEAAD